MSNWARASAANTARVANAVATASTKAKANKRGLVDVSLKATFLYPSTLASRHAM